MLQAAHFKHLVTQKDEIGLGAFLCESMSLKMLGRYLYTLIIGHKSCNMLSILNKLTL